MYERKLFSLLSSLPPGNSKNKVALFIRKYTSLEYRYSKFKDINSITLIRHRTKYWRGVSVSISFSDDDPLWPLSLGQYLPELELTTSSIPKFSRAEVFKKLYEVFEEK